MAAPWSSTGLLTTNEAAQNGRESYYALRAKMTSSSPTETDTAYNITDIKVTPQLVSLKSGVTVSARDIANVYMAILKDGAVHRSSNGTSMANALNGTLGVTKTHSSQTVTIGVAFRFAGDVEEISDGVIVAYSYPRVGDQVTGSYTFTVPAKTHYTVSYNANGGSGAPSAQTKWYGETLTLSSTKPTRAGHTFLGWSTSSTATSATYAAGGSYTANSAATLYAVWKVNTWTVAYDANGGSGAPASQTKTYGQTLELSGTSPKRSGYTFLGWSTNKAGTGTAYAPGADYTANAAATLYAVWVAVQVTSLSVFRSDSAGTKSDSGTYGHLSAGWKAMGTIAGTVAVTATANDSSVTSSLSNRSGSKTATADLANTSVGTFGGSYAIDTAVRVTVTATLTVSYGGASRSVSATRVATIPKEFRLLDALHGGTGLAIGTIATLANTFEVALSTILNNVSATIKTSNIDRDGTAPSEAQFSNGRFRVTDVDNETIAYYDGYQLATGETGARLVGFAEDADGASISNSLRVGKMPDGTNVYYVTDAAAFRKAINAAGASDQSAQNVLLSPMTGTAQLGAWYWNVTNENSSLKQKRVAAIFNDNRLSMYNSTDATTLWAAYTTANPQPADAWDVSKTTTVSSVITAASGVTVSSVSYAEWGKIAQLSVVFTGMSASTGSQTVGTVVDGKRPVYGVYATDVSTSYAVYAQLTSAGALTVYWGTAPGTSTSYTARFIYILA